ncbi:MAG: helix-turn-helix domain-containing protein [Candidatus Omnitrophica bacterium]|nr:helix-turn-helix domain-containing protein [Candidatus Omnitrophota bacterium]
MRKGVSGFLPTMKEKKGIGFQIMLARKQMGLTQEELAKLLGVHQVTVAHWEIGKFEPNQDTIKKLSQILNKPISYFFSEGNYSQIYLKKPEVSFVKDENIIHLPVMAKIPAGLPDYSEDDVEGYISIPRYLYPSAKIVVQANSDSMSPKIEAGDYCIIRFTTDLLPNKIMLVETEEGFIIKKVVKTKGDKIELHSINQSYKPIRPKHLKIIGEVVGILKRNI